MRILGSNGRSAGEIVMESRMPSRKEAKFIENNIGVAIPQFASMREYMDVGSKKVWASFRACHLVASAMMSTEFSIVGKETGAEVDSPELKRFLTNPNQYDSWEEMMYMWVFHMKLTGVAYWYKDEMDARGRPKAVYPLIPQYVKVYPHRTEKVSHYEYVVNGSVIRLERDEIIAFRRPHPSKPLHGLGDVEGGEQMFKEHLAKDEMQEKFLSNGAMPSGILTKEDEVTDENAWKQMKAWWDKNYSGKKNAGKTAMMNGKWSYVKLGLTMAELRSIEEQKLSVNQIFLTHGVPLSIAGMQGAANYATSKQDEINFRKYEIVPLVDLFVGKLNTNSYGPSLIESFSPQWKMSYHVSGLIDVGGVASDYMPLVEAGAMTLNELREVCGLGRIENPMLDQFYIGQGRMPLDLAGFTAPTDTQLSAWQQDTKARLTKRARAILDDMRSGAIDNLTAASKITALLE